ncbi:MAG: sigma-54-dependent transcriptional regulator [bacterium]
MGNLPPLEVLLVEDNDRVRKAIYTLLNKSGYSIDVVNDGESALQKLANRYYDLVITDYRMEKMDGLQLLRQIKKLWPATEVIIITAYGSISRGVEAIKVGAFDYLTKPFDNRELLAIVERFIEKRNSSRRLKDISTELRKHSAFDPIIGKSDPILEIMSIASRVATTDSAVLIYGESGTGKELVARAIHDLSQRKDKPFVPINCGAIPENLQESELFGYIKGAFTGADSDRQGLLEVADGGTVFLDEVAETAPSTQVKLLRFLQDNEIKRVGECLTRKINVRLIAATNKKLEEQVARGKFRQDLYYRINVIPLSMPALRDRKQDIPQLVRHFIAKYGTANGGRVTSISKRALSILMNYDWPGNVRELENEIERAVALAPGFEIEPELLTMEIRNRRSDFDTDSDCKESKLAEIERRTILATLERMHGNKKKTASELGISKTTLWRKLKYISAS